MKRIKDSSNAGAGPSREGPSLTLGQRVHRELQSRILNGYLLPGTRLTLRSLADSLDTSIQPVREAVGRLAADRALEASPNRSIQIPHLSREELDDLHSMRVMIEGEAAARFAARATAEDLETLRQINVELSGSYGLQAVVQTVASMQGFGMLIARGSGSQALEASIFSLRLRLGPHLAEAVARPEPFDASFIQFTVHINEQIVLACQDGDALRARELRRADLLTLQRALYVRLGLPVRPRMIY